MILHKHISVETKLKIDSCLKVINTLVCDQITNHAIAQKISTYRKINC